MLSRMQHAGPALLAAGIAVVFLLAGRCQQPDDAGVGQEADGTLQIGTMEATEPVRRGVTPGDRTLVIDAFRGPVALRAADDPTASLVFTKRGRGGDATTAGSALDAITITESGTADAYTYTVSTGTPDRAAVQVDGTVPPQTPLRVAKDVGPVMIDSLTGPLTVQQDYGPVTIRGAAAETEVTLESGDIRVHFRRLSPQASVTLRTQNGDIDLGLPADASAQLTAETQAGVIRTQGLSFGTQTLASVNAGYRYSAQLGDGETTVDLTTENGTITLRAVPSSPDAAPNPPADPDTLAPARTPVPADTAQTDAADRDPVPPDTSEAPPDTNEAPADTTDG